MGATLTVEHRPNGLAVLTLSNPARKNAVDAAFFDELDRALSAEGGVRAILLRAAGPGPFSAGFDVTGFSSYQPTDRLPDERLGEVLDRLSHHPAPSVALMTGPAFGAGCELALACDFRVGDEGAAFCMPPAKLGVVYALKGLARVASRIGEGRARYLFLTGRRVAGEEALRVGLLDVLAPQGQAEAAALALCDELAANAPLALAGIKRGLELLRRSGTPAELLHYESLRRASFNSEDAKEGRSALLEKRPPSFKGR